MAGTGGDHGGQLARGLSAGEPGNVKRKKKQNKEPTFYNEISFLKRIFYFKARDFT